LERSTSVFAAKDGSFRMPALERGLYDQRVRRVGYKDISENGISLKDHAGGVTLTMITETDPNELAWQLPANRWTPLVLERLSSDTRREEFVRQCAYCHQQGSWATRVQRSDEDWHAIFIKMGRMGGTISPELQKELPAALNSLQVAADGTIWVTLCLGNKVAHLNPRTKGWTIYEQKDGLYPHTMRI